MLEERWTPIPGYSGYYASTSGRIGSAKQLSVASHLRVLKPTVTKYGFYQIKLRKQGRYVTTTVQQLVALTYVSNPDHQHLVRHIDKNPVNNLPANLQWHGPRGTV